MSQKENNWVVGCLALVLTLAVLFGGQLLWNKYAVANPIYEVLQTINGIESVSIGRMNQQGKNMDEVKIYVTLSDVQNLQKMYGELTAGLQQVNSGKKYDIVIQDSRTPELEKFYYSIHYYLQEAIVNGNFASMTERIEAKANDAGVVAQIYVDTKNIYLTLTKETANMYVVIERTGISQEVK